MKFPIERACPALVMASLLVLAGCGTSGPVPTPNRLLGGMALERQTDLSELGSLEIGLESAEAARKVLSTIADVASYRITVGPKVNGLIAPPASDLLVKTCPAPTGNARKVSSLFSQLNPGEYTVTVETLDADGNVIGSATSTATVKKGVCTVVTLRVKLDPTYVKNSQGNLDVHVIVENGDVIEKPIEACKPADGFTPLDGACTPSPAPTATPIPCDMPGAAPAVDAAGSPWITSGVTTVISTDPMHPGDPFEPCSHWAPIPYASNEAFFMRTFDHAYDITSVHIGNLHPSPMMAAVIPSVDIELQAEDGTWQVVQHLDDVNIGPQYGHDPYDLVLETPSRAIALRIRTAGVPHVGANNVAAFGR